MQVRLPPVSLDLSAINNLCNTVGSVSLSGGIPFGGMYLYNNTPVNSLDISSGGNYSIFYKYTDVNSCVNTASGILSITTCTSQNSCPGNNCITIPGTISGGNPTVPGTNCNYSNPAPKFSSQVYRDTLYLTSESLGDILMHQWEIAGTSFNFVGSLKYVLKQKDLQKDSIDVILKVTDLKYCQYALSKTISISPITQILLQIEGAFVKVYPNPFNDFISIETNTFGIFSIYNNQGVIVFSKKNTYSEEIDLKAFQSGIYFYKFMNEKFVKSGKLIKQ